MNLAQCAVVHVVLRSTCSHVLVLQILCNASFCNTLLSIVLFSLEFACVFPVHAVGHSRSRDICQVCVSDCVTVCVCVHIL